MKKNGDLSSQTIFAVRGAVQIRRDSRDQMERNVQKLIKELLRINQLTEDSLVSIQFTQTSDLVNDNPARALRQAGFSDVPLFCALEPEYPNSLGRTVRVLVTFRDRVDRNRPTPLYIEGAEVLRPDLQVDGPR